MWAWWDSIGALPLTASLCPWVVLILAISYCAAAIGSNWEST